VTPFAAPLRLRPGGFSWKSIAIDLQLMAGLISGVARVILVKR
jgi:hypothetical protein